MAALCDMKKDTLKETLKISEKRGMVQTKVTTNNYVQYRLISQLFSWLID